MLKKDNVSEEFKTFFLLKFTKELIRYSVTTDIQLEIDEEEKKDVIKEKVRKVLKEESSAKKKELSEDFIKMEYEPSMKIEPGQIHSMIQPKQARQQFIPTQKTIPIQRPFAKKNVIRPLRIPEPILPTRLQYLKPTPTNKEIGLGKIDPLIKDPAVKTIQCDGADENIVVIGTMGIKRTNIILTKEEIDSVLDRFSSSAKIPLQEGIFKIVFGKLILSAIVSKVISSRFIIRKMMYSSIFPHRQEQIFAR